MSIGRSHTHIHIYIHTYIYTYTHTYIHTHIHIYIHTYIYTYTHTYIHTQLVWITKAVLILDHVVSELDNYINMPFQLFKIFRKLV